MKIILGFSFCKRFFPLQLTRGKDDAMPASSCVLVFVSQTKTVGLIGTLPAEEAKFLTNSRLVEPNGTLMNDWTGPLDADLEMGQPALRPRHPTPGPRACPAALPRGLGMPMPAAFHCPASRGGDPGDQKYPRP